MPIVTTPEERTRAYKQSFLPIQRLLDAGRFVEAVADLERIAAASSECAEAHNDLAVLYHAAGRLTDADRESRRALELDPFQPDIRDNHNAIVAALAGADVRVDAAAHAPAVIAQAQAQAPMSLRTLTQAAAPAPAATPGYREVLRAAESMLAAGNLDAAVAELERFVDRQPATAEAWNDLGVLHRDGGRLRAAHAALVVATTIEPDNRQAGLNLVRVQLELGQPAEALRTLDPILTRDLRDAEALTLAGDISLALHQSSDASAFYRSALAIDPSNADLAVKLATAASVPSAPLAAAPPPPVRSAPPAALPFPTTLAPAPHVVAETVRALEYDPRVRLVTPSETYDTVTCRIPLDRLPDPIAALSEMARLLKPGGKLWIDLDGPLEVIKHGAPRVDAPINVLPLRAR
ncbi:MAG TPA: tetratricopeptide repeat protein [Polyangia bacterium]|jgi:Flp pilus assembly protein TadD|nr:tetratricopeptide repeat protein [Polyangia bacterium]